GGVTQTPKQKKKKNTLYQPSFFSENKIKKYFLDFKKRSTKQQKNTTPATHPTTTHHPSKEQNATHSQHAKHQKQSQKIPIRSKMQP
ncbi:hypothetical protein, partial [Escherichia coli]|uniref:hypothetical protein n=1 Tax=Escherichia coli TaxID=562 RepID=UPI001BD3A38C